MPAPGQRGACPQDPRWPGWALWSSEGAVLWLGATDEALQWGVFGTSAVIFWQKSQNNLKCEPERDCLLPTKYRWGPAVKPAPMAGKQGSTEAVQQVP